MTTHVKAEAAVKHTAYLVGLAEEAIEKADRRIDKANEHLAQARDQREDALRELANRQAELAEWEKLAASFADTAAPATAHDAGVLTESNN